VDSTCPGFPNLIQALLNALKARYDIGLSSPSGVSRLKLISIESRKIHQWKPSELELYADVIEWNMGEDNSFNEEEMNEIGDE
jgi:hypothetical protein